MVAKAVAFFEIANDKKNFNWPNLLTLCRIALTPVVFWLLAYGDIYWSEEYRQYAGILFLSLCLTDYLDGYIAKNYNQVTRLGILLDPIADKILLTTIFFLIRFGLWWQIVAIIFFRESIITLVRFLVQNTDKELSVRSGELGRKKAIFQYIGVTCILFGFPYPNLAMIPALILTVLSGVDYLLNLRKH